MTNYFSSVKIHDIIRRYPDVIAYLVIFMIAVILFETAPRNGDFSWSESPRNALDGAFVLDFIKAMPVDDPMNWAKQYYYKYPALSILFYPPMLHVFIGAFYFVFGVSHSSAVACLSTFSFFLGAGLYKVACRIVGRRSALAASILLFSAPEIFHWSQEIMLEIPMMAFSVWAAYFLMKYGDNKKWQDLFICALFILAAAYTKQIAAIIGLALAVALVIDYGVRKFIHIRHLGAIVVFVILGFIPLYIMQIKFGAFNVTSVANRADMQQMDRFSIENIFWYLQRFPQMMGLELFFISACGVVGAFLKRQWCSKRLDSLVYICWFSIGYVVMTAIHLKETRHGIYLLIPLTIAAALFLDRFFTAPQQRFAPPIIALLLFVHTALNNPTPIIDGYNKASDVIASLAPANAKVLFAGNQDGNFIFNVRQNKDRSDISVIRADKIFLNIAIMPALGLNPKDLTREQVRETINQLGVSYVVTVPHVWSEVAPMAYLADLLESKEFQEVSRIPLTGSTGVHEVVIYKNLNPLPANPVAFDMELRAIGMSLKGAK